MILYKQSSHLHHLYYRIKRLVLLGGEGTISECLRSIHKTRMKEKTTEHTTVLIRISAVNVSVCVAVAVKTALVLC